MKIRLGPCTCFGTRADSRIWPSTSSMSLDTSGMRLRWKNAPALGGDVERAEGPGADPRSGPSEVDPGASGAPTASPAPGRYLRPATSVWPGRPAHNAPQHGRLSAPKGRNRRRGGQTLCTSGPARDPQSSRIRHPRPRSSSTSEPHRRCRHDIHAGLCWATQRPPASNRPPEIA